MANPAPPTAAELNLRRMALRTAGEVVELRQRHAVDMAAVQARLDELARWVAASEAGNAAFEAKRLVLDKADDIG